MIRKPWLRMMAVALAAVLAAVQPVAAQAPQMAGEPPADPILRIEAGTHSAAVTHLALDGPGRLLATASMDKTLRLWDPASATPLAVLRVPIGAGPEGSLYSTALSPDGKTLLAAGFTGASWDGSFSIYLFDVEQRRLKTRLTRLPELVNDLAFSPDGQSFAAVFSGRHGLAVWSATTGKLLGEDRDYGDIATGLAFDRASGRLATVAFDGMVRLYGPDVHPLAKAKLQAGGKPHSVAFSPDGRFLAVGYEDSLWVDVLKADDLKPAFRVDMRGLEGGNLAAVAWTGTPAAYDLAAAGSARDKSGAVLLRRWSNGGHGAPRDLAVARDSVAHLLGTPQGVFYASADPGWGFVDAAGRLGPRSQGQVADFRDIAQGRFALSDDGTVIEYGLAFGGTRPFRFDLAHDSLTADPPRSPTLTAPADKAAGITVSDWRNTPQPKVNGRPVHLERQELARSAAASAAGGGRALIGTDDHLRLVDGSGRELAAVLLPAPAWGVAASGNGKLALAALGDGTLRWYRLDGGPLLEELVAYFPSGDGRRWIAWTREGFFAHSEDGGADLAGYHVNKGAKATPDWVDFAQLYQLYYAPELLPRKLAGTAEAEIRAKLAKTGSTAQVLAQHAPPQVELVEVCPLTADQMTRGFARVQNAASAPAPAAPAAANCLPVTPNLTRGFARVDDKTSAKAAAVAETVEPVPVASVHLPAGTPAATLRFRVIDRQGGIGDVDVFANGKVVSSATRGFARVQPAAAPAAAGAAPSPAAGVAMERPVPLAPGRTLVQVRAYDGGNGVELRSPAVELLVEGALSRAETSVPSSAAPSSAAKATAPATAPAAPAKPRMFILAAGVDRYPAPNTLRFAVKDMNDVVGTLRKNPSVSYGGVEATVLTDEQVTLDALLKSFDQLAAQVAATDTVVIYLSGHGFVDDGDPARPYYFIPQNTNPNNLAATALSQGALKEKLTSLRSKNVFLFLDTCHSGAIDPSTFDRVHNYFGQVYILAAASPAQEALDSYKGLNGPFAYAVVEGLSGQAARNNVVNDHDLGTFVKREVPRLVTEQRPGHQQTANFKMAGGEIDDFELVQVK